MKSTWRALLSSMVSLAVALVGATDYAFIQAQLGELRWRFPTEAWLYSSPAIGEDGTVYIVSTG
ncbi:MAG TPA: cell surface protein, partial [Candidatus Latescibacteria bacterium]|nr:cell surface protein [Candidatus Latescibacterota bacterium]